MILLINLTLLYLIINQYLFFNKVLSYKTENIDFNNFKLEFLSKKMIYSGFVLSTFVFGYIFFFKILRLFRHSDYIDLQKLYSSYNNYDLNYVIVFLSLLLLFLFFRNLRKYLIFELKFSFLCLHYYTLSCTKNTYVYSYKLYFFYNIFFTKIFNFFGFKKGCADTNLIISIGYYFFKYIGIILLFFFFIYDILLHDYVLIYFSEFLPWFSIYNVLFQFFYFFQSKIHTTNDYYAFIIIYAETFYFQALKEKHNKLPLEIQEKLPYEIYKALAHDDLEYPETSSEVRNTLNFYLRNIFV